MLLGLSLVLYEFRTGFIQNSLGVGGHVAILICGTAFSVWGLKEIISSHWPRFAGRGYHFRLPIEGGMYIIIMIVLFIGSLIGRSNPLMLVFSLMVGPFILNGWYTFTMLRSLYVRREIPKRIMAGETFTASIVLENRKTWPTAWLMNVSDSVVHASGYLSPEVLFVNVPPRQERRGHYQLRLKKRGKYQLGPVDVTTRFPLGLVERGVILSVQDELLVYPRTGHLKPDWRRYLQQSIELVSHVRPQTGPFNDDLYRIREYRPGDDPRMIHWRTSARMSELVVCDYKESRDRDLILIVDPWVSPKASDEESDDAERALRFATTVCMDHLRNSRESSLRVTLFGKKSVHWQGGTGDQHLETLLDALALFEITNKSLDDSLFADCDTNGRGRVLLITTRPEQVSKLTAGPDLRTSQVQVVGASLQSISMMYLDDVIT